MTFCQDLFVVLGQSHLGHDVVLLGTESYDARLDAGRSHRSIELGAPPYFSSWRPSCSGLGCSRADPRRSFTAQLVRDWLRGVGRRHRTDDCRRLYQHSGAPHLAHGRAKGTPDMKVLLLRMEAEIVARLDEACERLGLEPRMDLFRK